MLHKYHNTPHIRVEIMQHATFIQYTNILNLSQMSRDILVKLSLEIDFKLITDANLFFVCNG